MLVIVSMLVVTHLLGTGNLQPPPDDPVVAVPLSGIVKMTSSYKANGNDGEASIELVEWGNLPIENIYVPREPDGTPTPGLPVDCSLFLNARDVKVGDYVTLKISEKDGLRKASGDPRWQQTVRSRLIVIDKGKKTVLVGMARSAGLSMNDFWSTDITKAFDICTAGHVYGKSSEFGAFTGLARDGRIPFGFKKTGEGNEAIKIGDTSYDCTWIKGNVNIKDEAMLGLRILPLTSEVKIWMAKNVPAQKRAKAAAEPAKSVERSSTSNAPPTGVVKVISSYKFGNNTGEASAEIEKWGNDGRKVFHSFREGVGKLAGKAAGGNPYRKPSDMKIGDFVVYKSTEKNDQIFANATGKAEFSSKLTVMDRDENAISFGRYEYDLWTTAETQPFDFCTVISMIKTGGYSFIGFARNSDQVPFGFTTTGEGKETLKLGDRTYDCTWITGKVNTRVRESPPRMGSVPFTAEMKIWIANDVPAK